jgi:hypothetical protein
MAIEGFDAALPIESAGFVPQVGIAEAPAAGPTLDAALAASREAAAPDLWVEDPAGPYRPHARIGHADPLAGMFAGSADDPLILHKLTIDDMDRASGTGRYGDSTEDYSWNEISTGAFDWAINGFKSGAQNDIKVIVETSGSVEEAQQRVNQYLADHGLTNAVQVYNSATWGADGAIVVTGHPPLRPPLLINYDLMGAPGAGGGGSVGQPAMPETPIPENKSGRT